MSMMARLFFVFAVILLSLSTADGVTVGQPLCMKNSQNRTLMTRLNLRFEPGETLGDLFGCVVNTSNNGQLDRVECSITSNETVVENGQTIRYISVRSIVNLDNATDTLNGCGITETSVGGQRAFQIIVAIRQKAGFIKKNDSNLNWYCVETTATNLFVSSSVDVLTPDLNVALSPILPILTFRVLKPNGAGSLVVATTCNAGEDLTLEVVMALPSGVVYRDFLTPWGLAVFNTYFGPDQASVTSFSTSYPITGSNGCIVSNGLNVLSPFAREASSTNVNAVYRTSAGKCYKIGNSTQIWFSTYVDFCSGVYGQDTKCVNYCNHNSGRKKREIEYETQTLYYKLDVVGEQDSTMEVESQSFRPLMIGLSVGVGVLLIIVVAIAAYVVCTRSRSKGHSSRDGFSNLSTASSVSSIPSKSRSITPKY